jgi:hypothetical protein
VSSGQLDSALAQAPPAARPDIADAAHQGFLVGMNDILMLGGILAIAGAVVSLWLIRESEIEREPVLESEPAYVQEHGEPVAEPAAA